MKSKFSKLAVIFAVIIVGAGIGLNHFIGANADSETLTREDVKQIVVETIKEQPELIAESLQRFQIEQRQAMQEERQKKFRENVDQLANIEAPTVGSDADDAVTVVEFFDYNCGFCKRAIGPVTKVIDEIEDVRFVFVELPILSSSSTLAAKYALAAEKQGKYFEYHTALMEMKGQKTEETLQKVGKDLGLDVEQLKKDAQSSEVQEALDNNKAIAQTLGISGTPAFVIGDDLSPGAIPFSTMKQKIDQARENKG